MRFSRFDSDILIWCGIGLVFGLITFFKGFKNLKLKRLIENIPTSKIRSMPMGLVEIFGEATKTFEMKTPFSSISCVFFQYIVEEYRRSGKTGRWVTLRRSTSPFPFKVTDDTGEISVNPTGAEVDLDAKNTFSNQFFQSLPACAKEFMDKNGIDYTGFLGFSKTMRLTEYYIKPGAPTYVLGVAKHSGSSIESTPKYSDILNKKKTLVMDTLKKLKKSPLLFKKYDLNKDGRIDDTEWEKARDDVAKWVDSNIDKEQPAKVEEIRVEIGKGEDGQSFFIADKSQKELVGKMTWKSSGFIFGGATLTIACAAILLYNFLC